MTSTDVVADHRAAGRAFTAAGMTGFVREAGDGETVLCMHGVPTLSFLYRKVLDELAARDLRGVAFDLPGLGLADRPENFDYTWTGLGQYSVAAIDALELQRFHLVVHDVGGPVGFELAAAVPDRVKSLTVLNTIVDVDTFTPRPLSRRRRRASAAAQPRRGRGVRARVRGVRGDSDRRSLRRRARRGRGQPRVRANHHGDDLRHRPPLRGAHQPRGDARVHAHPPLPRARSSRLHRRPDSRRDRRRLALLAVWTDKPANLGATVPSMAPGAPLSTSSS